MAIKVLGAYEVKTHFSKLLQDVEQGDIIVITKHGKEVAKLVPVMTDELHTDTAKLAIENLRRLRKKITLGDDLSIKDLIEKGRK